MLKKIACILLALTVILSFTACKTETYKCARCGTDVKVKASSPVTDEWTIFCEDCEEYVFDEGIG